MADTDENDGDSTPDLDNAQILVPYMTAAGVTRYKLPDTILPTDDQDDGYLITQTKKSIPAKPQRIGFMDFSPELRNLIYAASFESSDELIIATPFKDDLMSFGTQPAITKLSKKIRSECLAMFYAQSTFVAYIHEWNFKGLIDWVGAVSSVPKHPDVTIHVKLMDRMQCTYETLDLVRAWRDIDLPHATVTLKIHNCYPHPVERIQGFDQREVVALAIKAAEDLAWDRDFREVALVGECHRLMEYIDREKLGSMAMTGKSCAAVRPKWYHGIEGQRRMFEPQPERRPWS